MIGIEVLEMYREKHKTVPMSQDHGKTVESSWSPLPEGNRARMSVEDMSSKAFEDSRRQKEMFAEQIWKNVWKNICVAKRGHITVRAVRLHNITKYWLQRQPRSGCRYA